jgi:hypothetical protein
MGTSTAFVAYPFETHRFAALLRMRQVFDLSASE